MDMAYMNGKAFEKVKLSEIRACDTRLNAQGRGRCAISFGNGRILAGTVFAAKREIEELAIEVC